MTTTSWSQWDDPLRKYQAIAAPESWLEEWLAPVISRFPEIEQIYLLGDRARGPKGQKPDYSLLLYAGYDRALDLLTALARDEVSLRSTAGIIHIYVENYGATFCGIWGGALIPNEYNCDWEEGRDFVLWKTRNTNALPLAQRLSLPIDRRKSQRRREGGEIRDSEATIQAGTDRDELQPIWPSIADERRRTDRRQSWEGRVPSLDISS